MGDLIRIKASDEDREDDGSSRLDARGTLPAHRSDYFIFFTFVAASALFILLGVWKVTELVSSFPLR